MKIIISLILLCCISATNSLAQGIWIDTTFGNGGFVITNFGFNGGVIPKSLDVQSDGKIVIGGNAYVGDPTFFIARVNTDGRVDSSFGINGVSVYNISEHDDARKIIIQPDQKILLAGSGTNLNGDWHRDFVALRYNQDGSLDSTFASNGLITFPHPAIGPSRDFAYSMILQPDNKIVLGGTIDYVTTNASGDTIEILERCFGLLRLNPDGNFDYNFSSSQPLDTFFHPGFAIYSSFTLHNYSSGHTVGRQSDGKYVQFGYCDSLIFGVGLLQRVQVVRFHPSGELDYSFGSNGVFRQLNGHPSNNDDGTMLILSDNSIIFSPYYQSAPGTIGNISLWKLTPDGQLDTNFGTGGIISIQYVGMFNKLIQLPDGKIFAIGTALGGHGFMARYNPHGSLDTSFGLGGTWEAPLGYINSWTDAKFQPDGKLVAIGTTLLPNGPFVIARFSLDSVQVPIITYSTSFTVGNGWNLVSFPGIHPNSMEADTLFRFRDLSTSVFSFGSSGYSSEDTLKNGIGYWLKHNGQYTYIWNGTVQSGVLYPQLNYAEIDSFDGNAGWNIIGCYDYEFLASDLSTNPPGIINGVLYSYNPGSGYQPTVTLQPGRGYFTNLSSSGKIIYPPRATFSPKVRRPEIIKEHWAKIIITDADGKQYTLYCTSDDGELDKYLLPPKPPVGSFDVRFSSDRFVEDLSSEKIIDITGMEYPIKIKVSGTDIIIQDAINGEMFNVSLSDGDEISIENKTIDKLVVTSSGVVPTTYELSQNYPNPFNPITMIKYQIAKDGFVTLKIYDILGNEVNVLVNEEKKQGRYEVNLNASSLASGVYFYQLRAGSYAETKKMVLMK